MIVLYRLYQLFVMLPLMLVATSLTAVVTALGCMIFGGKWWGYYPPMVWARVMCALTLVRVEVSGRENISGKQSYVFVANHQGAYDIFAIYGYLGHNFRWMMKQSLEKIPLVGWACKRAGQVFVDSRTPAAIARTMKNAEQWPRHEPGGFSRRRTHVYRRGRPLQARGVHSGYGLWPAGSAHNH